MKSKMNAKSLAIVQNRVLKFVPWSTQHKFSKELSMKFLQEMLAFARGQFSKPTAQRMAELELGQAQRELLEAESGQEYAKRMAEYNRDRIRRLSAYLSNGGVRT
jgi:hypothetical protein